MAKKLQTGEANTETSVNDYIEHIDYMIKRMSIKQLARLCNFAQYVYLYLE